MNQIFLKVKEYIIFFAIVLFVILTSSTIILIIPKIVRKNIELIEEKNMLKIIPKNELELILIKEGIKWEYFFNGFILVKIIFIFWIQIKKTIKFFINDFFVNLLWWFR